MQLVLVEGSLNRNTSYKNLDRRAREDLCHVISSTCSLLFLILSICYTTYPIAKEQDKKSIWVWKMEGRGGPCMRKVRRGVCLAKSNGREEKESGSERDDTVQEAIEEGAIEN